jgi:hypothetical protein
MNNKDKYLKYKSKYLNLQKQIGSGCTTSGWWDNYDISSNSVLNEPIPTTIEKLKIYTPLLQENISKAEKELEDRKQKNFLTKISSKCNKDKLVSLINAATKKLEDTNAIFDKLLYQKQFNINQQKLLDQQKQQDILKTREIIKKTINEIYYKIMESDIEITDCTFFICAFEHCVEIFYQNIIKFNDKFPKDLLESPNKSPEDFKIDKYIEDFITKLLPNDKIIFDFVNDDELQDEFLGLLQNYLMCLNHVLKCQKYPNRSKKE